MDGAGLMIVRNDLRVNFTQSGFQDGPVVLGLSAGRVAVVWRDTELDPGPSGFSGVRVSVFNEVLFTIANERGVNSETDGSQSSAVVTQTDGGFVVAFHGTGPDQNGVDDGYIDTYFQRFDEDGQAIGPNIQLPNSLAEDTRIQSIATLTDGTFVILTARSDILDYDIHAHRFSANGTPLGQPTMLARDVDMGLTVPGSLGAFTSPTPGAQIAATSDGGYVVTWWSVTDRVDGRYNTIFAQGFGPNGFPKAPAQILSPAVATDSLNFDRQRYPEIFNLGENRNAVIWRREPDDNGPSKDAVFMRLVNDNGIPVSGLIDLDPDGVFEPDAFVALTGGYFLAAHRLEAPEQNVFLGSLRDFYDVALRLYDANGRQMGETITINADVHEDIERVALAMLSDGNLAVTWDASVGTADADVFGNTYDTGSVLGEILGVQRASLGSSEGTAASEYMLGGAENERLNGADGNDTILGGPGSDTILGGAGNDQLFGMNGGNALISDLRDFVSGGDGDDLIKGEAGNDELRGDSGHDTISGGFGVDTVIGGTGDDVLTGSAFSDLVFGGDGNDFVNGGFGSDRINGGNGADRFFHVGVAGHGSDWIQDFDDSAGDVMVFGGSATIDQFQVNVANTPSAGNIGVDEAFVIYRPTGQILWALVDGMANNELTIRINGADFDLLA